MWGGVVGLVRGLDAAGTLRARVFGEKFSFPCDALLLLELQTTNCNKVYSMLGARKVSTGKRKGLLLATPVQRGILFWVPNVPTIYKPAI